MFNFDYVPTNKDMLEIRICINKEKKEYLKYCFYYENGWTDIQPNMEIQPKTVKKQGNIKNVLE
ncbi:hypothetical protein [Arenibacter sp. H213]|uniref:Uncharacterized protein n=1 Tax=Arenibacter antarcticus TaxID=2040469 RepID=A0ABW5VAT5_9FLAO|nr:hypothetical protein [Arenibacter sp. H213]